MHGGRVFRQAKIIYTKQEEFSVNSVVLILLAIAIFVVAYLTYGRYLAKTWGIDPKRKTPAYELEDGVDYCPAKTPVLMGHHFSSIAGAGPITGPIGAAMFGWLPVTLWVLVGGIFRMASLLFVDCDRRYLLRRRSGFRFHLRIDPS